MPTLKRRKKGQVSLEYLMLIAGALVLIVVLILLFKGNIFQPAQSDIANRSGEIKSAIAGLQPSSGGTNGEGGKDQPPGEEGCVPPLCQPK